MEERAEKRRVQIRLVICSILTNKKPPFITTLFYWVSQHMKLNIQLSDVDFRDIQNNTGRGRCYQPKPKTEADNAYRDLDYWISWKSHIQWFFHFTLSEKINQKPKTNKHTYMNVTYISLNTKWKLNSFVFCFIDSLSIFNFRYSLNTLIFFHGSLVGFFSFSTLIYITYSFVFSVFRGRSSRKKLCDRALHRITKYPKLPETPRIKIEISKYINYCNAKLMSKQ